MDKSIATDLRQSLRQHLAQELFYLPLGPWQDASQVGLVTRTGSVGGVPYGSYYHVGDMFLERGASQVKGDVYYVVQATPGNPTITLQPENAGGLTKPPVRAIFRLDAPANVDDVVYVGIDIRPSARRATPNLTTQANRIVSASGDKTLLTFLAFYQARGTVHIEGRNEEDVMYVFDMVNQRRDLNTYIYQLRMLFHPDAPRTLGEIDGIFKQVLDFNLYAFLTEDTPIDDLPPGSVTGYVLPYEPIDGAVVIVEKIDENDETQLVEVVGEYDLTPVEP